MLGKLNSTLLISIGVALVLCAAVYYVNNARMNRIESAINRQNQVLTAFIANVQNEIRGGALRQSTQVQQSPVSELSPDVSSEEARNSVAKQMLIQEQQIPRIVVSDNEESASEDESDSENTDVEDSSTSASASDAETEATDAEEVTNANEIEIVNNNEVHHIKIVDIHNLGELPMFISEFKLETLDDLANNSSITELASASEEDESDCEDSASEAEASSSDAEADQANNEVVPLDIIEEIKTIKLDIAPSKETNTSANEVEAVEVANEVEAAEDTSKLSSEEELQQLNYEHLKVDELRKIALDLNKATKDEVKKLKKPELLYLLRG